MRDRIYSVIFIIGLLFFLFGFAFYLKGPRRSVQAESATLYSSYINVPANGSRYVGIPIDRVTLFVSNISMVSNLDSVTKQTTFSVMNESQFESWKANDELSSIITKSVNGSYQYALQPIAGHIYYFVFENFESETQSNFGFHVIITGHFLEFDYSEVYFHILVWLLGAVVCLLTMRGFSRMAATKLDQWSKPKLRTYHVAKEQKEAIRIRLETSSRIRRIFVYVVLIIFIVCVITYLPLFQYIPAIFSYQPIRSEYKTILIDYLIRTFIFRFAHLLPLILGAAALLLIIFPRLVDLDGFIGMRLHFRGPKQFRVATELWKKIVKLVSSKEFIVVCLLVVLPVLLVKFLFPEDIGPNSITLLTVFTVFGTYLGCRIAVFFHETCQAFDVQKYASSRFLVGTLTSIPTQIIPSLLFFYGVVLLNASDYWRNFLDAAFFDPLKLFQSFSLLGQGLPIQNAPIVALCSLVICFFVLFFIFLVIIPFLYSMTAREILSAILVFAIVEATQELVRVMFTGTLGGIFEPSSLFAPTISAIVAGASHRYYKRSIQKVLKIRRR